MEFSLQVEGCNAQCTPPAHHKTPATKLAPPQTSSGGAPHAAACAALLGPSRVTALLLIAPTTHTRGPGSSALVVGMDPFQKFGYSMMTHLPALLIRIGLAATVGIGRLLISPIAWVAARLLDSGKPSGGSGGDRSKVDRSNDGGSGARPRLARSNSAAELGGQSPEPGAAPRQQRSAAAAAAAASGGPPMSLRKAAVGGLGLINDVFLAPRLADGWWQVIGRLGGTAPGLWATWLG